jgi:cytoskeleton protein RodZ
MPEIGATLREARMRERIDVSEIEAQTKIRARYLRALENEEWDLLPGPTFIKSFLRTYADALDLDGKALVDEYRAHYEHPGEQETQPLSAPRRRRAGGSEQGSGGEKASRGYVVTVGLIAILIVVLVIGLLSHGSSPKKTNSSARRHGDAQARRHRAHARAHRGALTPTANGQVTLSLQATATVWVCLLGDSQRKLIPGVDLQAGETSGPFHAKRFEMTLGNASVSMRVNGRPLNVPASTSAIGYEITSAGATPLPPAKQPTCA